ncbi:hypothetical protein MKUB_49920 [Mycobacterium kubicae]|uniref:Type VII secretion-associated protein n=1 Tax=Mycobacterium kubicae TaxID=120959 RepID=A0AAX1J7R0_9MYCO|nr:hypothetical protein [Mycobacterium kubicae]MCV7094681.1 hypothetical protein [Mycobacterium kubicae]ORV97649.1 hypothetical protein AWC13_15550 [Mycobacterium kubicae]QNI13021.1 hypothetical protein GAN18_19220 [Mycobacterium kubicae]QPI36537.1 hypothetical protein I2456_18910 [Mycobacterium kubicae]GFG67502.1 hypothetical protein MKUB_49920 [Mycobacterium kubicae]
MKSEAAAGDRQLIEEAVTTLLAQVPSGWKRLHVEFEPSASVVTASVTAAAGEPVPVSVPAGVAEVLGQYHRRAVANAAQWRLLVVDCDADGTLSARTVESASARPQRRWPQRVLAAITVSCLAAAATIFAVDWRWSDPPRLTAVAAPAPAKAQRAYEVVEQWYRAEDAGDAARMRELACAHPTQSLVDWINTIAYYGQDQGLVFPDALTQFRDDGSTVWLKVAVRIRPIDEHMKQEVEQAQDRGGFFFETMTLANENENLKVCDGQR